MLKEMSVIALSTSLMLPITTNDQHAFAEEENLPTITEASANLSLSDQLEYQTLSDDEKDEKEISISEKYEEGDVLSEEDTIFLLNQVKYSNEHPEIILFNGSSSKGVSKSVSKFGTKVTLKGTMYQNISFLVGTSTFRGNLTLTRNSGSLKKVALSTHHSSYGMVGWSGKYPTIGRVYKGSVSMSKTSNLASTNMDKSTKYTSVVSSYTTMYSQATVTTSKGDQYTVTSPSWSRVQ